MLKRLFLCSSVYIYLVMIPSFISISLKHHQYSGLRWHICDQVSMKEVKPKHTKLHSPGLGFVVVRIFRPFHPVWMSDKTESVCVTLCA